MKIIVDAFGGDNAPLAVLQGCQAAVEAYGVDILLTGDEAVIRKTAQENNISLDHMEIVHAPTVIPVEEEPTEILKSYQDCSMAVGFQQLAQGNGDAFVSAGSTGALVVGASLIVKRIKGIKRAAIGTVVPNQKGSYMLIDGGANHECRPEMLVQFALMGSVYMEKIAGIARPKVGLVNIGTEETKGTPLQVETFGLLGKAPVNFIGNVEARGLPLGECDVAVCDGFTGNVVLKTTEGMAKFFSNTLKEMFSSFPGVLGAPFLLGNIKALKKKMDYSETGGAPLLGLQRPVIKAHGSSNGLAFQNAIRQAKQCCEADVVGEIQRGLAEIKSQSETQEPAKAES